MLVRRRKYEKVVYKVGEVIEVPIVKRVEKHVYKKITKPFKIRLINENTLYGEYLND